MLDIKYILENPEEVKKKLEGRGGYSEQIDKLIEIYEQKRTLKKETDELRNQRKTFSKEIGQLKSQGKNADSVLKKVSDIKEKLSGMEQKEQEADNSIRELLLSIPNLPLDDVPVGADESDNVLVSEWGSPVKLDFVPKSHFDLGESLDIIDFTRGAKIAGSGFILYKDAGARLERALIQYMLNMNTTSGYREMFVPFLVNRDSLIATGQLPKFEEDQYHVDNDNFYLNPTAEVPLTNIYRDEMLNEDELPIRITAYAPSFRKEAGSYGKDTRGLIRVHQFNKVELVKFTKSEDSEKEHQSMLEQAEKILQSLDLPYRVMILSSGDMGFSAAKCYDIEVWLPSQSRYREISSVSNCLDFQARRGNIRFKRKETKKPEFVHTLNGSGLAVGRTMVAIMENYQNADGSITVPMPLVDYMGGLEVIK